MKCFVCSHTICTFAASLRENDTKKRFLGLSKRIKEVMIILNYVVVSLAKKGLHMIKK